MLSAAVERESEVVTTSSTGSKSMKPAKRLAFSLADADLKDDRYSNGHAILGILDGWITNGEKFKSAQQAVWTLESPVAVHDGEKLVVTLPKNMLGCLRISVSKLASLKAVDANMGVPLAHALDAFAPKSARNSAIVARAYTMSTAWDADLLAKVRAIRRKYLECMDGITPVLDHTGLGAQRSLACCRAAIGRMRPARLSNRIRRPFCRSQRSRKDSARLASIWPGGSSRLRTP